MRRIEAFMPGIDPPPAVVSGAFPAPRPAALGRLLARARRREAARPSCEAAIFDLMGVAVEPDGALPVAAATHWLDFDSGHDGIWMRADPVHLRADPGGLLMIEDRIASLAAEEAAALARELNAGLADAGVELQVGREPARWYLRLPDPPAFRSASPLAALGRHVGSLLPDGPDAARWRRIGNDLQMLLKESPVNEGRVDRGLPAVNSLWFWGAGSLPAPAVRRSWRVLGDDPVALGLARFAGLPAAAISASTQCAEAAAPAGDLLIVTTAAYRERCADAPPSWEQALFGLESLWFFPLWTLLWRARLHRLTLRTLRHAFEIGPADCWRFWRRPRPLRGPV